MRKIFILFTIFLSLISIAEANQKQELPDVWKKWLDEEVVYIITPKEREIFFSLKSERERETFMRAFWLQRDPTPGTPTNEFRDEHYRRLKYATEFFGRGTVKFGWETDRGRIYIILGEPVDTQRYYETSANTVPTELWQYYGDTSLGLPPVFNIVFYQDMSMGDYKLYSPSFDGPQRLIRAGTRTNFGRYEAYEQIKQVSAELAEATLSLIPGTGGDPSSQSASLSSDLLVSNIQRLPEKKVKSQWAEAFARHKEIVTTDYSVSYIDSNHVLFVHQENNRNYLHVVIEPNRTSMNQYEEKAYAPMKLNAKISDLKGETVHQEEKNIQVEMNLEDFRKIERRVSAVGDVIPLVEGDFTIDLLLRNTQSKEFSSVEGSVHSPSSGMPSLSPILFLFNEKALPRKLQTSAFLFHGRQLYPNTRRLYAKADDLMIYFEIYNPSLDFKSYTLSIAINSEDKILASHDELVGDQTYFLKKYQLSDFASGYYKVLVTVRDNEGNEILSERSEFSVSHRSNIPRPWSYSKIYPPLWHPYFSMVRAYQYLGLEKFGRVIHEVENLYNRANPHKEIAKLLALAYFNLSDYARVIEVLDPIKEVQEVEIIELIGKSYFQLESFESAIEYFKKTLITGGEIIEIINLLGYSYLEIDDRTEALSYFERSLKLSPNQPKIREIIEKIKKKN
ncbi:MAG: GWxTD domain-containing protein [Candidatus Aminicenantes bacterium]|nr:MAG: GWxTD domain-containing protein [Candidatus Aminicenantes bacterium]